MKNIDPEARLLLPAPPAPSMPPGLVDLMEDLSRSVLRNDPEDIFAFCAEHMRKLLVLRDGEETEPKTVKIPSTINVANVLAASHKKAEKRRASYDRLLTEPAHEVINEQAVQEILEVNEEIEKSKGDVDESAICLLPDTEQVSQILDLNDKQITQEKVEDTRYNFELAETVISTVAEQSLSEGENTVNLTESLQDLDVAISNDDEEKPNILDDEFITFDQKNIFIANKEEISYHKSKEHEELEEVKRTVSDAIAEIETTAIKTVTNITLNLSKNCPSNSVESELISQDHLVNNETTNLDKGDKIQSESDLQNTKNEINMVEKGSSLDLTDVQEQTLKEIKTAAIFVTALEEMTHNLDAIKPIVEINKTELDYSGRLSMVLEEPQEVIEASTGENSADPNHAMLAQEEIYVQKHISELKDMNEENTKVPETNYIQNTEINVKGTNNEPLLNIQNDSISENNIHKDSNLNTEHKELVNNSVIVDSALDIMIKQEEDVIKENIASHSVNQIVTEAANIIGNTEKVNGKDMTVGTVERSQTASDGVIVISEVSGTQKEPPEKPITSEVPTDITLQKEAITNETLNEIIITVTENKSNSIDGINNGEEEGANNDLVIDLSSSDRSLKSNDSCDTDDATNGMSVENSAEAEISENSANPSMDLETAAVTIQKVFRSFLFKSRASTIDDETPLDIPYLPDAIQEGDGSENFAKLEEDGPRISNKEHRNMGLIRMDTVLQTVNEEKSLSLSDDSSTLSSAATVIQAHVRGYLARNKLSKTASNSKSHTQSSELENDQQKNKTVLNIHIVPEGSHFMSRDESLTLSLDLPLDTSPPSLTSYHSLGYDITERRKLLRREDAIQSSISPPSTNSGKSLDIPFTTNDIDQPDIENYPSTEDKSEIEEVKRSEISGDTTPTVSTTDTVIEVIKEMEPDSESKESKMELNSNEFEAPNLTTSQEKDVPPDPHSAVYSGVMHSGEFHDVVLPPQTTQLSRDDPKHVAREFKASLVYFLIWN